MNCGFKRGGLKPISQEWFQELRNRAFRGRQHRRNEQRQGNDLE